jgi:membrane protease YdiL (CAAX protease family)
VTGAGQPPEVLAPPAAARPPVPAGIRFLFFLVACGVGVLGTRALLSYVESASGTPVPSWPLKMSGGLLLGHWWTFRAVQHDGWRLIGFGREAFTLRRIATGLALGTVAVGVPAALLLAVGWLRIEPTAAGHWGQAAFSTLLLLVPAALWEELAARGYLFALLREKIGARRAVVATSILFGLLHLQNPGVSAQSIALVTLAGIFLGAILVTTASLYAAWAAHVAWNFVMSGVLHAAVSGLQLPTPSYQTVDAGPDWATGGGWGPEGGLFTAVALLVGIYFMWRPRRRGAKG